MSPSFKKVLVAASIGAVATLSLYLAVPQNDEPNNIESALRGGAPSDVVRPPVNKTPKGAGLSDVPAESFSEGDGEQLAVDIRDGLEALKARMESSERTRGNRDAAFREELDSLQSINADNAPPTLAYGPGGTLRAVSGDFELSGGDQPAAIETFVANHKAVFGLGSLETPVVSRTQDSALGRVYHLDRTLDGYPVWGRQLVVSESNARVRSVTGKMQPLPPLDTRADFGETEALQIAQAAIANWSGTLAEYTADKGIFVSGGKAHFAYRLDIASTANKGWHVYVSMNSKAVLSTIVKHYENTPSQGVDLLNVTRTFQSELASDGVTYVLKDPSFPTSTTGTGVGYDDPDSDNYLYVQSEEATSGWRPSAVSAIHNARATYDYFLETHGRNSFNANNESDTPLPLLAIVDVLEEDGSGLDNAYWYGGTMYYGKGSSFNNLAASLDVAAHEFGHGVVEYTAGLRYHNQSGALNESFADLFGAMVDRDDWLIGEDLYDNGAALRDMETPERGNQPSTFADYEHLPDTREGDWGGVHINSGIQNRAFYLMAEGLSNEGSGTSIGKERLEQIAYQALLRLGEDAEFIDAYLQMKLVAEELYGEEAKAGVEAAWAAVGIAEATVPESDDVEVEFSLASGSDAIAYLYPRDETFDYGGGDTYVIHVYYTDGTSTRDDFIAENDLGPINDYDAALIRPAIYSLELSDGSAAEIVIYVNTDGQLVLADALNAVDDQLVESELSINAAAISPDGDRLVLVPTQSRNIVSISLTSDDVDSFEVLGPSYSDTDTDSPVQQVDAINFDYTGSKIAFDFLSCQPNLDGSECVPFWSIGVVDIDSGAFDYPFPGQDEYIDLGYPQFSNITDDVFVFDFLDYRDGDAVDSLVLAYNRETDVFSVIGSPDPDSIHGGIFSLPTVRGEDTSVVYQYLATIEGSDTLQPVLYSAVIDQDFEGQTSGSDFLFNFVGGFAEAHRSGIQDLSADLLFSSDEVALGQVSGSELIAREISVKNTGTRDIEIASVAPSTNIRTNLTSTTVSAGETLTFSITIRPSDFNLGEASGSVAIGHDGDSGQKTILVSATVIDAGETDGSGGSDTSNETDSGGDDATDGGDTSGSDGGGDSGGVSDDDSDGDGLPDDRDPQPSVDNSEDLARYKWVKEKVSWEEAQALAAAEGGYLASISSQFENDLIYAVVSEGFDENSYLTLGFAEDGGSATYVFIGGSDQANEGTFVWDSGEPFEYENWGQAEPDSFNDAQDVVGMALEAWPLGTSTADAFGVASEWNDIAETNELTFVIEFDEPQGGGSDGGDGGATDAGESDSGSTDDASDDAGTVDDGGSSDTGGGSTDDGTTDGGTTDGGTADDGSTDDGGTDNGAADDGFGDGGEGSGGVVSGAGLLDIDADGERAALSDGLLIIRHLFGFQGDSLIAGALASGAEVTSASDIGAVIESRKTQLDVDEDGETKPLTDGLLIIRYLFGFQGQSLVSGAVGPDSDLSDSDIAANLQALEGDDAFGGTDDGGAIDEGATDDSGTEGGTSGEGTSDDGGTDEGTTDAGSDDGSGSGGSTDSGAADDGVSDSGSTDTGEDSGGSETTGGTSDGSGETGETGGGSTDGGSADDGTSDSGSTDAGEDSGAGETTAGTSDDVGDTSGGTTDGGGTSGGSTDGDGGSGSGSTDGGSADLVDIQLSVLYERVYPVIDTSSGFYSARLDYEGAELLPGRLLNVSVFDAETDQEFVSEIPWQTDKSGQVTAELPIGRQFYFKVYAKTDVEGSDGTWRVSVHDNQGSSSIASYPVYVAVSNSFETDQDRSITLTIESGWTGSGYTETRASGPFAIVDSMVEAMLKVGDSMELTFRPLEVYWSPVNSTSNIGTSFYTQGTVFILGKEDEDTDEFDAHIIVHEWGHYFQDVLSRDDSLGGPHGSGDILDPRVAFSEGWANALSGLVLGDPDYKDTAGTDQNGGFYLPLEEGFPSSVVSITSGWFSEDSVGEIVTDLFDATNDAADADNVSLALTEMTKALVGDVKTSPVATTIFSLLAPVIAENGSQASQIDSLLKHHDIALDGPATDVYGSNESQVANGVTSNALPVFTEIPIDGEPVRICQDKRHIGSPSGALFQANKLGNRTLGRFTVQAAGDYRFSSSSGLQNGTGASSDPEAYVFSSDGYFKRLEVEGPESQILTLEPGEYWFEAYDWAYLTTAASAEPCQFVEITSQ